MKRRLYALLPALLLLIGAASAQIVGSLPFNLQEGTPALASQVMANFNAIVSGTNANSAKNGVNTDITQLSALTTPLTRVQGGSQTHIATAPAGGGVNAQTVAATLPVFQPTPGDVIQFVPVGTNTAAATLDVAGTGAVNIYRLTTVGLTPLVGGEIVSGSTVRVLYDGTQYQLLTDATGALPPGAVLWTAGAAADPGYLLLQGQAISRTVYAALFARIGTTYGIGDNVTTFNLPDVRGRTIFSVDGGVNRINNCGTGGALASVCGLQTIAQANLPNVNLSVLTNGITAIAPANTTVGTSVAPGIGLNIYLTSNFTTLAAPLGGTGTSYYPPAIVLTAVMKY